MHPVALFLLCHLLQTSYTCYNNDVREPIVRKEGDFMIGGMFNIGRGKTRTIGNESVKICEAYDKYAASRALAMAWTLDTLASLTHNYTLGYEIFDACNSRHRTRLAATRMNKEDNFLGMIAADVKIFVQPSVGPLTAQVIPSVTYIYSDDELLDKSDYPNLLSLIDTEQMEAMAMIRLLRELDYKFMDIWYHAYSQEMAEYVYEHYLSKVGCGRLTEYTDKVSSKDKLLIQRVMNDTYTCAETEPVSNVQLLLFNNRKSGEVFLKHVVNTLKWKNKVYIFGYTNGRSSYVRYYTKILNSAVQDVSNDIMMFVQSDLLELDTPHIKEKLIKDGPHQNPNNALFDRWWNIRKKRKCIPSINPDCIPPISSWLPFVVAAAQLLASNINNTLLQYLSTTQNDTNQPIRALPCMLKLRDAVYLSITTKHRETNDIFGDVSFKNSTCSIGYTVRMFQQSYHTSNTRVMGKVSFSSSSFNESILSQIRPNSSQKICAIDCLPGYYQIVSGSLSCCWLCRKCDAHKISTEINSKVCRECDDKETNSSSSNTKCIPVKRISLTFSSHYTLIGLVLVCVGLSVTLLVLIYIVNQRSRPLMKASDPVFCYTFLLSIIIGNLAAFFCLVKPSRVTCIAEYVILAVFVSLVSSSLSFRCGKIFIIFTAAEHFSKPRYTLFFSTKGQIAYNIAMLLVNLSVTVVSVAYRGWLFDEIQYHKHSHCHLTCDSNNPKITIIPFIIPGTLSIITLIIAFKMRAFPHNFKETLNIFMATLIVFISCIMFLTGYSLSPAKIKALMRSLVIYTTSLTFLACMFVPKVIILSKSGDIEEERAEIKRNIICYTTNIKNNLNDYIHNSHHAPAIITVTSASEDPSSS